MAKKSIKIKQIRSGIRQPKDQVETLKGLGLNKVGRVKSLEDTPSVRGMINKVAHLVVIL